MIDFEAFFLLKTGSSILLNCFTLLTHPNSGAFDAIIDIFKHAPLFCSFLKGAGTDDHTLIRVMVSRSEIDLFNIRKEFRKNFATSLYSMIKVVEPFFKCREIHSRPVHSLQDTGGGT